MLCHTTMPDYRSEADARILIDQRLRHAGWDPTDKQQVRTEVASSETSIVSDDVAAANRFLLKIDYVLFSSDGRPRKVGGAKAIKVNSQKYRCNNKLKSPLIKFT
jgi:type I site-specific restriction endonuclease